MSAKQPNRSAVDWGRWSPFEKIAELMQIDISDLHQCAQLGLLPPRGKCSMLLASMALDDLQRMKFIELLQTKDCSKITIEQTDRSSEQCTAITRSQQKLY